MHHPVLLSTRWLDADPDGTSPAVLASLRRRGVVGWSLDGTDAPLVDPVLTEAVRLSKLPVAVVELCADVNRPDESIRYLTAALATWSAPGRVIDLKLMSSGAHDVPSAPRADSRASQVLRAIGPLLDNCEATLSLRHRATLWLSAVQDAVRVLMRVNQARFAVTLSLPDWSQADGQGLDDRLHLALPRLSNVRIDGRPASGDAGYPGARPVLLRLSSLGYLGPVTLQPVTGADRLADALTALGR